MSYQTVYGRAPFSRFCPLLIKQYHSTHILYIPKDLGACESCIELYLGVSFRFDKTSTTGFMKTVPTVYTLFMNTIDSNPTVYR